jgi:hypothetical protein
VITNDAKSGNLVEASFFLTEFRGYSPTVQYDLEGFSVLYCIVQYSGYYQTYRSEIKIPAHCRPSINIGE